MTHYRNSGSFPGVTADTNVKNIAQKKEVLLFWRSRTARPLLFGAARMAKRNNQSREPVMQISTPEPHPKHSRTGADEADVGSGERTPGQVETDNIIKEIERAPAPGTAGTKHAEPPGAGAAPADPPARTAEEAERGAEKASERDKAGHGQIQRERHRSRQSAAPGDQSDKSDKSDKAATPDTAAPSESPATPAPKA